MKTISLYRAYLAVYYIKNYRKEEKVTQHVIRGVFCNFQYN